MRRSIRIGRNRILALGASLLISGSALAAAALPAQAAPSAPDAANKVTITSPGTGTQTTNPLSTAVDLPVTATETDETATLTFSVTAVPAVAGLTISQPLLPGDATGANAVAITGAFAAPYTGKFTVTAKTAATLASSAGTSSVTFTWTADNTITVPNPGTLTTQVGTAVSKSFAATDNDKAATVAAYAETGLPTGLAISAATGAVTGTPTAAGTYAVTVTATDSTGAKGTRAFTWTIKPTVIAVTAKAPAKAYVGVPVKVQATATDPAAGAAATVTWTAKNLPAGLAIGKTTGLISGRPTAARAVTTTVTATDADGTGSATIAFKISNGVVIPNPGAQVTTVGEWKLLNPIGATDPVPGDKPHYTATGLPAGMGFESSPMLLYGWPTTPGVYHVSIHETGSLGSVSATTFKLTVKSVPGKSAAGQIHLALDGKCLRNPSGKTVRIEPCGSGTTERWTVGSDGTIRVNGRCLTVAGTGSYVGRQLQVAGCGKANQRQRWSQGNHGELVSPAAALCVADAGSKKANGVTPVLAACRVKSNQQWTLPAQPVLTALGGYCADDHFSSGANGNIIDMFWCNSTVGQDWTFRPDGTIRAGLFADKCLTIRGKKSVIETCASASKDQKWTVVRTGAMSSELTQGGACLAIPGLSTKKGTLLEPNGTQLRTSKCSKTDPRDLWHIA